MLLIGSKTTAGVRRTGICVYATVGRQIRCPSLQFRNIHVEGYT